MMIKMFERLNTQKVKWLHLCFCDPLGGRRRITVATTQAEQLLLSGCTPQLPEEFFDSEKPWRLLPDPEALQICGSEAWVPCCVLLPDQTPHPQDMRAKLMAEQTNLKIGLQLEFYLFKSREQLIPADGEQSMGDGQDGCFAPRQAIAEALLQRGILVQSHRHGQAEGQNVICLVPTHPLQAADWLLFAKNIICQTARDMGLYACLLPKPLLGKAGSGIVVDIWTKDDNEAFGAGLLAYLPQCTLLMHTAANSYSRFGGFGCPKHVSWSQQQYGQYLLCQKGESTLWQLRTPDWSANPYTLLYFILKAGQEGMRQGMTLPQSCGQSLYGAQTYLEYPALPLTLGMACRCAQASAFLKQTVGERVLKSALDTLQEQALMHEMSSDKFLFEVQSLLEKW